MAPPMAARASAMAPPNRTSQITVSRLLRARMSAYSTSP
jgi:hypothetical protein